MDWCHPRATSGDPLAGECVPHARRIGVQPWCMRCMDDASLYSIDDSPMDEEDILSMPASHRSLGLSPNLTMRHDPSFGGSELERPRVQALAQGKKEKQKEKNNGVSFED